MAGLTKPLRFDINEDQLSRAKDLFDFGPIAQSITQGEGNLAGALGEILFIDYLRHRGKVYQYVGNKDYDVTFGGWRIDVKTKRINYTPKPEYSVSVAKTSLHQRCDVYVFAHVLNDYSTGWLDGWMFSETFIHRAIDLREGEPDPLDARFKIRRDCYNLQIKYLNSF